MGVIIFWLFSITISLVLSRRMKSMYPVYIWVLLFTIVIVTPRIIAIEMTKVKVNEIELEELFDNSKGEDNSVYLSLERHSSENDDYYYYATKDENGLLVSKVESKLSYVNLTSDSHKLEVYKLKAKSPFLNWFYWKLLEDEEYIFHVPEGSVQRSAGL